MTIPIILGLQIVGNVLLFSGVYAIIKIWNGESEEKDEELNIEVELKQLSRELKKL